MNNTIDITPDRTYYWQKHQRTFGSVPHGLWHYALNRRRHLG